jgi:hypothetical protein
MAGESNIVMDNNLAVINYNVYGSEAKLPTEKCPTDCLVILDQNSYKDKEKKLKQKDISNN